MITVKACQICESFDIKKVKQAYSYKLIEHDSGEALFEVAPMKYLYIFKFGVICYLGYTNDEIITTNNSLSEFCQNNLDETISEEYFIETETEKNEIGFQKIHLPVFDPKVIRLIMLNLSQSVALENFSLKTDQLLHDTQKYTLQLVKTGKIRASAKKLRIFIGSTLYYKNRISENLYIFDSPSITWENEELDKIDRALKNVFDLEARSNNIHSDLQIIKENLDFFVDLMHQKKSFFLEWIVIVLILIEVINMFVEKLI